CSWVGWSNVRATSATRTRAITRRARLTCLRKATALSGRPVIRLTRRARGSQSSRGCRARADRTAWHRLPGLRCWCLARALQARPEQAAPPPQQPLPVLGRGVFPGQGLRQGRAGGPGPPVVAEEIQRRVPHRLGQVVAEAAALLARPREAA